MTSNKSKAEESTIDNQPNLLKRIAQRPLWRRKTFWVILVIPNLLVIVYFFAFASPIYVSRSSIVVYQIDHKGSHSLSSSLSGGSSEYSLGGAYALKTFIPSEKGFNEADQAMNLRSHWEQGDFISHFGGPLTMFSHNRHALWQYYRRSINLGLNKKSHILHMKVEGYSPGFVQNLSETLLHKGKQDLNQLNRKVRRKMQSAARQQLQFANKNLKKASSKLSAYRSKTGTYNPSQDYKAKLSLLNKLTAKQVNLISKLTSIQDVTPHEPVVKNIKHRLHALNHQITQINKSLDSLKNSDAKVSSHYSVLETHQKNAESMLKAAEKRFNKASRYATRHEYFMSTISGPSKPVDPSLPNRIEWVAIVMGISLVLYGILK